MHKRPRESLARAFCFWCFAILAGCGGDGSCPTKTRARPQRARRGRPGRDPEARHDVPPSRGQRTGCDGSARRASRGFRNEPLRHARRHYHWKPNLRAPAVSHPETTKRFVFMTGAAFTAPKRQFLDDLQSLSHEALQSLRVPKGGRRATSENFARTPEPSSSRRCR
jgi:hypothetical protein